MKRKNLLWIFLSILGCLFFWLNTTITFAEDIKNPITDADIDQIYQNKDNTELVISYVLEDQKELILKTSEKDVLDIDTLKKELGEKNVQNDSTNTETKVILNDSNKTAFKLFVNNKTPFTLSVLKSNGENIFDYDLNTPETKDIQATDDDESESGWVFSETLKVSEGPILEHSDGTSTRPYIYFGDYNYAIRRASISESFDIRGKSRKNSLTTPGSALLFASPGSRIQDGPSAIGNHLYTDHYGDHQEKDYNAGEIVNMSIDGPLSQEDLPVGSPRSYTSNNLYNYVVESDGIGVPGTSGPNKVGQSYAMLETPKFYYRTNPKTGLEEQKMVFKQRAYYVAKKNRPNPEITTTIKLSFSNTGRVQTTIKFKNTGKDTFENFIGFSNHDLSLNEDDKEVTQNGKRIGNYVKLRTLGNKRGMYMQSDDSRVRTTYYLNREDHPDGWAGRSSSKSYLATKGFMHSPGLIELIGSSNERYYPWKRGKDKYEWILAYKRPTKFYDKKKDRYRSPYVHPHLYNAFSDQGDSGDALRTDTGGRLGVAEKESTLWDAGLTMRTRPQNLYPGGSVKLGYLSQMDVKGTTFNPVFDLDAHGTDDDPQILQIDQEKLPLTGFWYDFDSTNTTMYYSIDSEDPEDYQILFNGKQSSKDAFNGKHNEIKDIKIPLKGLEKKKHKIRFFMEDAEGHRSPIQEHTIKFVKPPSVEPQIEVTTPDSSSKNPHDPVDNSIDLKGFWNDKDSKQIQNITYKIDDGDEQLLQENLNNPTPGKMNDWELNNLSIDKNNDFDLHKIQFRIIDKEGHIGTSNFYFKHVPGGLFLSAPEEIDFGSLSVSPTGGTPVKPTIENGKVILADYREKHSKPISVSLTMDKFYKEDSSANNHNDEDGDDSEANIDTNSRNLDKKESLIHETYWKDKIVENKGLIIGQSNYKDSPEWQQTTDLTNNVLKNLKLKFKSNENGASVGKYVSHWTWETVDSVQ